MRVSANFCTYSKRKHTIDRAIDSIKDQVDVVRVHYNDYVPDQRYDVEQYIGGDYTDRSKFIHIQPDEIAFTCDDDIQYPKDYVQRTVQALEQYGGIVTWHGRKLKGTGRDYYLGHKAYHFKFHRSQEDVKVDVMGTGVSAFYSNEFNPNVLDYEHDKMVDLIASLEAAKQGVPITCLRHQSWWITDIKTKEKIYQDFKGDSPVQDGLADQIYEINSSD